MFAFVFAAGEQPKRVRTNISVAPFYGEYHGHRISDLEVLLPALRPRGIVWLAGDSSLDDKHWLLHAQHGSGLAPCNGYEKVIKPARGPAIPDVAYHINRALVSRGEGGKLACVNTAVEESTLADRAGEQLLAQDVFLRDHIGPEDTLVVSVGCNDVALRPTAATAINMLMLTRSPTGMITSGWAPGTRHFLQLFREKTMAYVRKLIAVRRPRRVVVCTIYYLDQQPGGSWADTTLRLLGYDANPAKLKAAIATIHERAHLTIADVDGVEVVAVPLFRWLDGTDPADYVERVEPSAQGGAKMAAAITDAVLAPRPEGGWPGESARNAYRGAGAEGCAIL